MLFRSKNREIALILNTPLGKQQRVDDSAIRAAAVTAGLPCITTRAGISAIVSALTAMHRAEYTVKSIQEHHKTLPKRHPSTSVPKKARV